jgi:hypothetical protein
MNAPLSNHHCKADSGCRYMRNLSKLEQLAGFDLTAKVFAAIAAECEGEACHAACEPGVPAASDLKPTSISAGRRLGRRPPAQTAAARPAEPIPFSRSALIDIKSDGQGNYVECRTLKLGGVSCPTSLSEFHQYWRLLRAATPCQLSNLDPQHLIRGGIIGNLHIVDTTGADPGDFRFALASYLTPFPPLERPGAHPVAIYADQVLRDYNTVRLTSIPRLQRIRCRVAGVYYHYTRLILPFMDDRGGVSHLAVAIHLEPGNGMRFVTAAD